MKKLFVIFALMGSTAFAGPMVHLPNNFGDICERHPSFCTPTSPIEVPTPNKCSIVIQNGGKC